MSKDFTKQHIVPKCYLDRFATCVDKKNGKYVIGTRTIVDGVPKLFEQATSQVGYIKNFYDVTDKDDPKYWEHFFAEKVDSLCDRKLGGIISSIHLAGHEFSLDSDAIRTLSTIIIAQTLRIPASFDYFNSTIYPKVVKSVKNQFFSTFPAQVVIKFRKVVEEIEMSDQEKKEHYLNGSFSQEQFERYIQLLCTRTWIILVNEKCETIPFVTSDNPVLVERIDAPDSLGIFKNGIMDPKTCLFFPLSPSIAVANYSNRGLFALSANKMNGRIFRVNEPQYIIQRNVRIIEQAYNHSFIPHPFYAYIMNL